MPYYIAQDGCRIHYRLFGQNGPSIVLIPGLGGDGRFWNGVVKRLEDNFQLIVPDHRGAGQSDRPDKPYSIPLIASDIAGILRELDRPVHIVGHSTGGAVTQVIALDHPEVGLSYTISSSWAQSDERFQMLFNARAELLDAGLAETYQRLTYIFGYTTEWIAQNRDICSTGIAEARQSLAPFPVTAARIRMLLDHDRLADLPNIRRPVQVISSTDDILTPPALSEKIATAIPDATLICVPGAHFHPLANPDKFASVIRQFISRTVR